MSLKSSFSNSVVCSVCIQTSVPLIYLEAVAAIPRAMRADMLRDIVLPECTSDALDKLQHKDVSEHFPVSECSGCKKSARKRYV